MKKRWIMFVISVVLMMWMTIFCVDFYRVTRFEKPLFCVLTESYKDGGSGKYLGIGYSFAIEGNFMPEDEFPGVTRYHAKFLGSHLKSGIRD